MPHIMIHINNIFSESLILLISVRSGMVDPGPAWVWFLIGCRGYMGQVMAGIVNFK